VSEPKSLRIVFAGTPDFAVPALRRLVEAGHPPLAVLTQPDRPAGRGRKLQSSPVKKAALEAGLPVHQPARLKDPKLIHWLTGLKPDLIVVVAYGLLLPREILRLPRFGCWNIHASLLPRWRGAAPVQRAIEAGDDVSGVCIMQMDEGLDTGPVLAHQSTVITADDTGGSLHDRLASMGAETLLDSVRRLATGETINAVVQADDGATYAAKLQKAEAEIDWKLEAAVLERKIRAFNPWPVAWCDLCGERTRIWAARALTVTSNQAPGKIVATRSEGIDVATGGGLLRLLRLQRPGGRQLSAAEYLNARPLAPDNIRA